MPLCPNGHSNLAENRFCALCGVSLQRLLQAGEWVRQYQIEKVISTGGGFSNTYLVHDTQLFHVQRVMKSIQTDAGAEGLTQSLFEQEARTLASLNHPFIPKVYAYFVENGCYYLIQDYIEGFTLSQHLQQRGSFNEAEALAVLEQVLEILSYLHSQHPPIIHRDIKPENIIMNAQNKVYLVDFGAVKESLKLSRLSTTGRISAAIYTEGYAPPEQLKGVVFLSSDIYALGVTLLHLLTNQHPSQFYDEVNMEWTWEGLLHISPRLARILQKMMNIRPVERYETVEAVRQALQEKPPKPTPNPNLPVPTFSQEQATVSQGKQHLYRGELAQALDIFQKVQQQNSRFIPAYIHIGDVYFEKEMFEEAMFQYKKALQLEPSRAEARLGLSITYHEKGNANKAAEELAQAIREFKAQLQHNSQDVAAGLGLGIAYTYQSRTHDAINLFRKLIRIDPENPDIYYNMGLTYYKSHQPDKAIDCFEKATLLNSQFVVAFNLMGLTHFENQQWPEAVEAFRKAVQINPLCDYVHNNLGLVYYSQGHIEKAVREFITTLKLKPDNVLAHYSLGLAFHRQGELEQARLQFEETLKLNPYFAYAHNNLGLVCYALGDTDSAISAYKKALGITPDFDYAHNNLGIAYFAINLTEKAIKHIQKAVQLNPNYFDAHYNLGATYYKIGQLEDALKEFRLAVQLNPKSPDVYQHLGNTYYLLGQTEDAIQCYERAIQLDPDSAPSYYNLAVMQEAEGLYREAVRSYIKTVQMDPGYAVAYNNLGFLLLQKKRWEEAITCFKEALNADPKLILAHNNLGTAYYEMGRVDEALAEFERASWLYTDLYGHPPAKEQGDKLPGIDFTPPADSISFSA